MDTISIGEMSIAPKRHVPQLARVAPRQVVTVPSLRYPLGNSSSSNSLCTELARSGTPFRLGEPSPYDDCATRREDSRSA